MLSANGTQLAAVDWNGLVRWWSVDRGTLIGSLALGASDHVALAISPRSGVRAVVARHGSLWTAALPSSPIARLLVDDAQPVIALEMAAGGTRFAVVRKGGVVEVRRWDRPDPMARIADDQENTMLAMSADGRRIARTRHMGDTVEVAWGRTYERQCSIKQGEIVHLSFAPDGLALAVTGGVRKPEYRPMLAVWEGTHFQRVRALHAHMSLGVHCALSADAVRVLSCGADGLVVVSSPKHCGLSRQHAEMQVETHVLAWSPDGQRFARVNGSTVEIVDPASGTIQRLEEAEFFATELAFSPDGSWLAARQASQLIFSGQVRFWNVATGALAWRHDASAHSLAWAPGGDALAVGLSGEIAICSRASGSVRRVALDKGQVRAMAYSPDGKTLAVGIWRNQVWLLDTHTDAVHAKLVGHSASVIGLAFLDRGRALVSISEKDPVLLRPNHYKQKQSPEMIHWDLDSATELRRVELEDDVGIGTTLVAAPDGSVFVTGHMDGSLCFWDPVVIRPRMKVQAHRTAVTSLTFAADGRTVSSGARADGDGMRHWQADEWRDSALLKGHKGAVVALAFTPDSRWLVSGSGYDGGEVMQPGEIFLWDPRTAERRTLFSEHDNAVEQLALAPDGMTVVARLQRGLVALDVASSTERWRPQAYPPPLHYLRDGKILIAGKKCLDPDTGETTGEGAIAEPWPCAIDPEEAAAHARSADGRWFAAGTTEGQVLLLDQRKPEHVAVLEAHQSKVGAMAFSLDGRWLATSAGDVQHRRYLPREVILWRVEDLRSVHTLWGHTAGVQAVAFSPDGCYLATGGASQRNISHPGDVRLWHLPSLLIGSSPLNGSDGT